MIATVVGGVILAGLGKLAGVAPQVWDSLVRFSGRVWSWLTDVSSLRLPNGIWALVAVLIVVTAWRLRTRKSVASPQPISEAQPALDENELAVMKVLAERHGASIAPAELARRVELQPLRASKVVEKLEARGLVSIVENYIHGPAVHLTNSGRDLLLDLGIVD